MFVYLFLAFITGFSAHGIWHKLLLRSACPGTAFPELMLAEIDAEIADRSQVWTHGETTPVIFGGCPDCWDHYRSMADSPESASIFISFRSIRCFGPINGFPSAADFRRATP